MAEEEGIVPLNEDDFQLDEEDDEVVMSSSPSNRVAMRLAQGIDGGKVNSGQLTAFDELIEDSRKSPSTVQPASAPSSPPKNRIPFSRGSSKSPVRRDDANNQSPGGGSSESSSNQNRKSLFDNPANAKSKPSSKADPSAKPVPTALKRKVSVDRSTSKSVYDRLVGKTPAESAIVPKPPSNMARSIGSWFTKESAEEREIRSALKNYRARLTHELQYITKAVVKHRRRIIEQVLDFEKQEKQLIAWGLKAALPKFHLQAWFRLARCRLQEETCVELESLLNGRQKKAVMLLQQFEESKNRAGKFSLRATEEFCQAPDVLMISDYTLLSLSERLRQYDMLCQVTTKQFILLEPHFAWKDHKQRRRTLFKILNSYNTLPKLIELTNIETDLSWSTFCKWVAVRMQKLKLIEQDFSDFIEDQREMEGRLFFRWYTSVMLMVNKGKEHKMISPMPGMLNGRDEAPKDGGTTNGNEAEQPRLAALKVTPTSIKAFVRYFATDVVGVKYGIPKDYVNANIALTESLFYRRISTYVFRYIDKSHREKDEYWRFHTQKCRYIDPTNYHVPDEYYKPLMIRELQKSLAAKHNAKDSDDDEVPAEESAKKDAPEVVDVLMRDSQHSASSGTSESPSRRASSSIRPNTSSSNLAMITEKLSSMKTSKSSNNLAASSAYAALPPTPMSTLMKKSPSNMNLDLASFIGSPPLASSNNQVTTPLVEASSQFSSPQTKDEMETTNSPSMEDGADGKLMNEKLITGNPVYGDFFSSSEFVANAMRPSEDIALKLEDAAGQEVAADTPSSPVETTHLSHHDDGDDYGFFEADEDHQASSHLAPTEPITTPAKTSSVVIASSMQTPPCYEEGMTPVKVQKLMDEMKTPAHLKPQQESTMSQEAESSPIPDQHDANVDTPQQPSFALSNAGTPIPPSSEANPPNGTDAMVAEKSSTSGSSTSKGKMSSSPSSSSVNGSSAPSAPAHAPSSSAYFCRCPYCMTFSLSLRLQRFHAFHHASDVNRMIGNPLGAKSNSLFHVGGSSSNITPNVDENCTEHALSPSATTPMSQLAFLHYGAAYVRSSRVMSWIATAMTPREMIFYLTLACKWILRDAIDISGSRSIIGADLMVPLFTLVLIHSDIPNIHMLLYILLHYGDYDDQGDISYNLANLEGSLQFVMSLEVSPDMDELFEQTTIYRSIYDSVKVYHPYLASMSMSANADSQSRFSENSPPGVSPIRSTLTGKSSGMLQSVPEPTLPKIQFNKYNIAQSLPRPADICNDDIQAMEELGEWLRDQQTMEETIAILQSDGWML